MPFNQLDHHALGGIRPRFRLSSTLEKEAIFSYLKAHIHQDPTVNGSVLKHYAILRIPDPEAHYWSPELQVRVDIDEDDPKENTTTLKCLIGPKQSVWVLFAFFYGAIGLITFFAGSYGVVQMTLGKSSAFVWFLPVGLLMIPGLWLIAREGQRTGRDQMLHLVSFLYHTLDAHGEVERIE